MAEQRSPKPKTGVRSSTRAPRAVHPDLKQAKEYHYGIDKMMQLGAERRSGGSPFPKFTCSCCLKLCYRPPPSSRGKHEWCALCTEKLEKARGFVVERL